MGEPLQLISCEAEGKFEIGQEACRVLRSLTGPICVIAVCGRARQGKSFILNRIAGTAGGQGFEVGPTQRPCTKGLWMWSAPIPRVTPDGQEFNVILLDTEGIDAYDQTRQYSTQIFSIALLLSNLFIYNQMGGIDEVALDRLSLVTEVSKHIRKRAGDYGSDAQCLHDLGECAPQFLWLLRDFFLDLKSEDGAECTADDYLEMALHNVQGTSESVVAKNEVRRSICSLFPRRRCVTLVRPVHDETQLQQLGQLDPDLLRPEFTKGMDDLMENIFQLAGPKIQGGIMLTGPLLAGIAQTYVTAINGGVVPTISTTWQGVSEQECSRAVDLAEASYANAFPEDTAPEVEDMAVAHALALEIALQTFRDTAAGDEQTKRKFEERLRLSVEAVHTRRRDAAFRVSLRQNEELLEALVERLQETLLAEDTPVDTLAQVVHEQLEEYKQAAQGPGKWEQLAERVPGVVAKLAQDRLVVEATAASCAQDMLRAEARPQLNP
ncbi:hypothetical protein CYMTET_50016 [Cymbomonas tetramitiformis]|uniref:GB1/RHD3-type G domain-containing protein n=1 Tax=Cymbomonas tetramitiformis TaxID=36881 RepID=A0AAE0BQZ3_9CHLO|nr:hypothetical protein CYMTET_50016 [Cymbomonas tetramitiformis]|eukprot:gene7599-9050_t